MVLVSGLNFEKAAAKLRARTDNRAVESIPKKKRRRRKRTGPLSPKDNLRYLAEREKDQRR